MQGIVDDGELQSLGSKFAEVVWTSLAFKFYFGQKSWRAAIVRQKPSIGRQKANVAASATRASAFVF